MGFKRRNFSFKVLINTGSFMQASTCSFSFIQVEKCTFVPGSTKLLRIDVNRLKGKRIPSNDR